MKKNILLTMVLCLANIAFYAQAKTEKGEFTLNEMEKGSKMVDCDSVKAALKKNN